MTAPALDAASLPPALLQMTVGDLLALLGRAGGLPAALLAPLASVAPAPKVTLRAAIDELLMVKARDGFRPKYVTSLRQYLNLFARGREDMDVRAVDVACVTAWFAGRKEGTATKASNLGRLASLLAFAERRGWIAENCIRRMDKARLDTKAPRILTPDDAEKFWALTPEVVASQTASAETRSGMPASALAPVRRRHSPETA